ncbi:cation channel sperm-associated protein 2 [Monodelphis domestica]|uniref:cation channel sperm-associated protein 2 n=1 Tax=Monodelphis domestica TaxID=13616 RepID=UPI0024E271D6|nr:cation channel sperm-associated protein 2 [Monodelphis domestica]XP_056666344.1 cation channel sperm-associated protein 2 [Monodelphis domestica]XP_056666345.1 cation channel sperm-associated protein 2 [Monodelphis domestica]XP_056666346.1 cation channel sperm-associated protein 2 [Monodelphis domestica]XP_056666347.1 cation channel sperm-associated protein 2 [Monodelphis domestica]
MPNPSGAPSTLVLSRADAVRSRLIDTFSLIEHLQGYSQAVPRYNLREFLDTSKMRKLMQGDHQHLVRFTIKPGHDRILFSQRQQCRLRVRCNRWAPLSLWAGWVIEKRPFINLIIFLIFLNTILLMVEIEIVNTTDVKMLPAMMALEVGSWFILFVFIFEILLMWLYSFFDFWKNAWSVFDFFVTVMSTLPEVVVLIGVSGDSMWLQLLRIFRVLRSLKLFARFRQVRVIILALVRALKTMTFVLALLLIFFYIFALCGIYFFEGYTRSDRQDLTFQMFFMDMPNSVVSVFILFTLDHWYALLQDTWKVAEVNKTFSSLYVVLWLLLGAIIFRNIIVAMMVTNFQAIRNEINEQATHMEVQQKADMFKRQIIKRRQQQFSEDDLYAKYGGSIRSENIQSSLPKSTVQFPTTVTEGENLPPKTSANLENTGQVDWETHVHQNLPGLMDTDHGEEVVWPRDSLFRYFELLEKLQHNIEERKQLQEFAVKALINLEDH